MAEQSSVALEVALAALRAVTELADALASTAVEEGVSYGTVTGMLHRFEERLDAYLPVGAARDELREQMRQHISFYEQFAAKEVHEEPSE